MGRQPATKPYSQEFIHPLILSPTPTYIGIEKTKNEENNAKKIEFVFHLVLLGIIKRKPRGTKPNPNISFASIQWECSTSCYRCQPFFAQELCRLPKNRISVVGWNRQARLNGSPGVQHPHNVNQASEKTSRNYLQHTVRYARVSSHYYSVIHGIIAHKQTNLT